MTQEIKQKLEQAAENYAVQFKGLHGISKSNLKTIAIDFKSGAQTILENPKEWGLMPILDSMDHIEESDQNWSEVVNDLKSQLTKYREALEDVINNCEDGAVRVIRIAKEALKQEGTK